MLDVLFTGLGATAVAVAYTGLRIATGVFFATSGFNKLFNNGRHCVLRKTLDEDGVPCVRLFEWVVPGVEFFGGLALVAGLLTPLAASGLLAICLVAMVCEARRRVASYRPINKCDVVCDYLYLPEIVYALVLAVIVAFGSGPVGLDAVIRVLI
jgi:putative oxidoreductase